MPKLHNWPTLISYLVVTHVPHRKWGLRKREYSFVPIMLWKSVDKLIIEWHIIQSRWFRKRETSKTKTQELLFVRHIFTGLNLFPNLPLVITKTKSHTKSSNNKRNISRCNFIFVIYVLWKLSEMLCCFPMHFRCTRLKAADYFSNG